ncbi:hypothetical protein FQZ97_911910 [compost metagenome]
MPGRVHGDDVGVLVPPLVGVVARQLDRGLVGFGAAVVERDLLHAGQRGQAGRQRGLLRDFVDVRGMDDAGGLLADGGHQLRVGVAQAGHADPGQRIQVLAALGVPEPDALAVRERHRQPGIDIGQRRAHRGSSWGYGGSSRGRLATGPSRRRASQGKALFERGQRINHIQFAAQGACLITPKIRLS